MRRRLDRAQMIRSRRLWWERNGAFVRGLATGVLLSVLGYLLAHWLMKALGVA
jgi:hypothetical protein